MRENKNRKRVECSALIRRYHVENSLDLIARFTLFSVPRFVTLYTRDLLQL